MAKKLISILIVIGFLGTIAYSQNSKRNKKSYQEGLEAGKKAASKKTSPDKWGRAGCCTFGLAWFYPEISNNSVPKSKLEGKSEAYISGYVEGYRKKRKSIRQKHSFYGGLISLGTSIAFFMYVFYALANGGGAVPQG